MDSKTTTPTQTEGVPERPVRRYDIDWLRVLAVLLLFPFHTARIFDTLDPWYVKNEVLSDALTYFIFVVHPWHMPLLFLLAGASTWFALGFRSGGQYAKERITRLLVPFIFGLLVIVPPQSYFGFLDHTGVSLPYLAWYPNYFSINPADIDGYFLGGFALGHLWFILFLFIFSLLALPLFLYLRNHESGRRFTAWLASVFSLPGLILLPGLLLYGIARLINFYPNPLFFITYFILGFILLADARFEHAIDQHKAIALILGPMLYLVFGYFLLFGFPGNPPSWSIELFRLYNDGLAGWFIVIAFLGYAKLFLKTSNSFLRYNAQASYPIYILHQTVIVIFGYFMLQWSIGILPKYVTILLGSIVVSYVIYDLLIKRFNLTRFLFGMRLKKKANAGEKPLEKTTA
jgi:peptidoglycan/LPS O-acetylase OafA/YrhL